MPSFPIAARSNRAAARFGAEAAVPTINGWELTRPLAKGRFSRVFLARPAGSTSPPAHVVKWLDVAREDEAESVSWFRREALVGRLVSHPHLAPVLASHAQAAPYYLVMPWLAGKTLRQTLNSEKPLHLPVALGLARQLAEAMEALHLAGWMHSDIKPENTRVGTNGHLTLLDLGFARRLEDGEVRERGRDYSDCLVGDLRYAAPEALTSTFRRGVQGDIYSLGVILFELLAGRPPFLAREASALVNAHLREAPPDLRRLAPLIPGDLARWARTLLAKDPLRRPRSTAEVVRELTRWEIETFLERNWSG